LQTPKVMEQNSVPRKKFRPKREKAIQDRAKLDKTQVHYLYSSLNTIRAMKWARHVRGRTEIHTRFSLGNLNGCDHLKDKRVDGR
jgi:hypothetical protein